MTPFGESGDTPPPHLLAAYLDGELTNPADRQRVEAWLHTSLDAGEHLESFRRLRKLVRETRPEEPPACRWDSMLQHLRCRQRIETAKRQVVVSPIRWITACAAVAAACVLLVAGARQWSASPLPAEPKIVHTADDEVFPVASANEVEILSVKGDDTATLVVGRLPVHEPLELVESGEITIMQVRPDARDNMVPQYRVGGTQRPLIWARLETD